MTHCKIVVVLPNNKVGGAERAGIEQWKRLRSRYDVKLWYLFDDFPVPSELDVLVIGASIKRKLKCYLNLFFEVRTLPRGTVMFCHLSSIYYVLACFPHKTIECHYFIHTDPNKELTFAKRCLLRLQVWRGANLHLNALSEDYKEKLESYSVPKNIFKNYVSLPAARVNTQVSSETGAVLFVGRCDPVKNVHNVPKIAELLNRKIKVATLEVAGFSGYFNDVYSLLNASGNVELSLNVRNFDELARFSSGCQFVLVCSEYEGLPTILIEAAYLGLVPLCLSAPGVTEFIEGLELPWLTTFKDFGEMRDFVTKFDSLDSTITRDYAAQYYNSIYDRYSTHAVDQMHEEILGNV